MHRHGCAKVKVFSVLAIVPMVPANRENAVIASHSFLNKRLLAPNG